jgi:hypothetical protein
VTVVLDTSPLILLAKIEQLELLTALYDTILIPWSVLDKVKARRRADTRAVLCWCDERSISVLRASERYVHTLPKELGAGERAALALAMERDAELVVLDDQEGRRLARARGLAVTGTIGVLVEARAQGKVASLRRELDRVVEAGLWISETFYDRLLREFRES